MLYLIKELFYEEDKRNVKEVGIYTDSYLKNIGKNMQTIALFGEAGKGDYRQAYVCDNLTQLVENLGHPPPESRGLYYAIQAILNRHRLIFFRVKEEGFSFDDYIHGLSLLRNHSDFIELSAIFAPGVGNSDVLEAIATLCRLYRSILITTESDLYDFLTEFPHH